MTHDEARKYVAAHARYYPDVMGGKYGVRWPETASHMMFSRDTRKLVLRVLAASKKKKGAA